MSPAHLTQLSGQIHRAAKAFRHDANSLLTVMAEKFGFDINTMDGLTRDVYGRHYNNKGILTEEWSFYFHGSNCCFENSRTGQVVDVSYEFPPEFGYLNGYFFFRYIQTTTAFRSLAREFGDATEVWEAIEWLSEQGLLIKVQLDATTRFLAK